MSLNPRINVAAKNYFFITPNDAISVDYCRDEKEITMELFSTIKREARVCVECAVHEIQI